MKLRNVLISVFSIFIAAQTFAAGVPSFNKNAENKDISYAISKIQARQAQMTYESSSLIKAVKSNNVSAVKKILAARSVNLEATDERGHTALMFATNKDCNTEILNMLLKANANVLTKDMDGRTALIHAARNNNLYAFTYLLRADSEPDAVDDSGFSPLMYAVANNNSVMVNNLLSGYRAKTEPLLYGKTCALNIAIDNNNAEILSALINGGANIFYKGVYQMSPLMYAAYVGRPQMLAILIKAGGKVNEHNDQDYDRTPLIYAAARGSKECIEILLQNKADKYSADSEGNTPFDYAVKTGDLSVSNLLR